MRQEYKVLQGIQQCRQVCKPRGSGYHGGRFFMVLDLLGQNLVEMRRGAYGGRMDLSTAKVRGRRGPAGGRRAVGRGVRLGRQPRVQVL